MQKKQMKILLPPNTICQELIKYNYTLYVNLNLEPRKMNKYETCAILYRFHILYKMDETQNTEILVFRWDTQQNEQLDMCAQPILESACASAQSY